MPRAAAGALLDSLAGDGDSLWPRGNWPAMRFGQLLRVGARGGHGPNRYTVEAYTPTQWIRFRFTKPRGFDGFHEYTVRDTPDGGTELTHPVGDARARASEDHLAGRLSLDARCPARRQLGRG